jgi:hypothetical protein
MSRRVRQTFVNVSQNGACTPLREFRNGLPKQESCSQNPPQLQGRKQWQRSEGLVQMSHHEQNKASALPACGYHYPAAGGAATAAAAMGNLKPYSDRDCSLLPQCPLGATNKRRWEKAAQKEVSVFFEVERQHRKCERRVLWGRKATCVPLKSRLCSCGSTPPRSNARPASARQVQKLKSSARSAVRRVRFLGAESPSPIDGQGRKKQRQRGQSEKRGSEQGT